jgi:hypothetical protein
MLKPLHHNIIIAIYEKEVSTINPVWYVTTPNVKSATMRSLMKSGMLIADRILDGVPTRFKLSEAGLLYGKEHYKPNQRTTKPKDRRDAVRDKYDHHDYVTRRTNNI